MITIVKRSKKPFKSGKLTEVVVGNGTHNVTGFPTYVLSDGSFVEVRKCRVIEGLYLDNEEN